MRVNRDAGVAWVRRAAGVALAATAAVGLGAAGAANADTFVPLTDGHTDGAGAVIDSRGEHALISPSLAGNGAGRNVWVSGDVSADVDTPDGAAGPWNGAAGGTGTNNSSTHGTSELTVGYVVGCQVSLGSLSTSMSAALSSAPSLAGSLSLPLKPGEITWVTIDQKDLPHTGTYHVDYQDSQLSVEGCAGYAQARQVVVVEIIGDDYSKTTLYGQPFSLG
ncbi:MspA family porin [Nocardia sp. alder85J]|uniref:MspA family porin n=1 Tax=Nocardia sp. alder85J TaxID=2862949 RepID=UPI001CD63CB2|nr:MspA family porin [Nocardia sp. alder85J]MCX4093256.1 MspA family porin [Nocardia sp. alder85J]